MSGTKYPREQTPPASPDHSQSVLEPATAGEVSTKLDLARQFLDMGDPESARHMLDEVLNEGDAAQKAEAQRLIDAMP